MAEPVVTLTDYALAALCAWLAHLVYHRGVPGSVYRGWFTAFFAATGLAALFGGTVHGFFPNQASAAHATLWTATLLAIGVGTLTAWAVGARLVLAPRAARWVLAFAAGQLAAYALLVLFVTRDFRIAVAAYLPATLFLWVAVTVAWRRQRAAPLGAAALGLLLTLVAAVGQQLGVGLHPVYFDHNALYHLAMAIALGLVYVGARHLASGG